MAEPMRRLQYVALLMASLALSGCGSLFGEADDPPLPGTRLPVLAQEVALEPDAPDAAPIALPAAVANEEWPQEGGTAGRAVARVALAAEPREIWSSGIGSGIGDGAPRLPAPIVAGGRVFTMDSEHEVRAFDAASGERLWRTDLASDERDDDTVPGGLAYERGRVFATTGFAKVFALDAGSGETLWTRRVNAPIHGAPAASDGRIFFITINNSLFALDAATGDDLWQPYQSMVEAVGLLGSASPAVADGLVIAPFSSGDIVAVRPASGRIAWQDSLASARRTDELAYVAHIRGRPVVDRGRVFAVSYAGVLASISARTGERLWDRQIGGLNAPWLAGDFLYLLSSRQELLAIDRNDGSIAWIHQLPLFEDEEDREEPILWTGPVLAGERLIVVGSNGQARLFSPFDGSRLAKIELADGVGHVPVVAGGRLFLVSDDGVLSAYQ
jgi:outer membrane protein assembly factor BamB